MLSRMTVDWRAVRQALLSAKPEWQPSRGDEPNPDYDFARAIIEAYRATLQATCAGCKSEKSPHEFYRCWDCNSYLCADCIGAHMGPKHVPHPRLIAHYEQEIERLNTLIAEMRDQGD